MSICQQILFVLATTLTAFQLNHSTHEPQHLSNLGPVFPVATKARRLRRLVIQDLLNLLHNLRRQLGDDRNGTHVILNLLDLSRTEDYGANVGVLGAPRQAELGGVAAETFRDLGEATDFFDLSLTLGSLELLDLGVEEVTVVCEAGTFGDAVVVLAGEQTGGERGPDGCAICWSVCNLAERQ